MVRRQRQGYRRWLMAMLAMTIISRFLSKSDYDSKALWHRVKSTVRQVERENGVLIFDDTIQEKQWTDERELMCWHYDHCSGRNVKGINLLNALYDSGGAAIPVAFELIKKPLQFCDLKTRQCKRKSEVSKNTLMRQMIETCCQNNLKLRFVLMDSWFSAEENFKFIRSKKKHFIAALKSNRLVALSEVDQKRKRFNRIDSLVFPECGVVQEWIKGYAEPVNLVRQVFTNKDGSTGTLSLVCSDLTYDYDAITTTYQKRWNVEVFHQSLKSNASLARSPTRTLRTQSNHVFMSIVSASKVGVIRLRFAENYSLTLLELPMQNCKEFGLLRNISFSLGLIDICTDSSTSHLCSAVDIKDDTL